MNLVGSLSLRCIIRPEVDLFVRQWGIGLLPRSSQPPEDSFYCLERQSHHLCELSTVSFMERFLIKSLSV